MVHPFNPKDPSTVPNSYVVSCKGDFNAMLGEIAGLASKEIKLDIVCKGMPDIGMAFIKCDADFAEKMKELPHVDVVEPERRAFRMNRGTPRP